jgi:hypothetical protein
VMVQPERLVRRCDPLFTFAMVPRTPFGTSSQVTAYAQVILSVGRARPALGCQFFETVPLEEMRCYEVLLAIRSPSTPFVDREGHMSGVSSTYWNAASGFGALFSAPVCLSVCTAYSRANSVLRDSGTVESKIPNLGSPGCGLIQACVLG